MKKPNKNKSGKKVQVEFFLRNIYISIYFQVWQ